MKYQERNSKIPEIESDPVRNGLEMRMEMARFSPTQKPSGEYNEKSKGNTRDSDSYSGNSENNN